MKPASYVDRSRLDSRINRLLQRDTHIALKGASKCGKSWLRQKCVPEAIVVQCSFEMTISDLYRRILRELGVEVTSCITNSTSYTGEMTGKTSIGIPVVGNIKTACNGSVSRTVQMQKETLQSADDIKFIAEKIKESIVNELVNDSFGNVGILQKLLLNLVADESGIDGTCNPKRRIYESEKYKQAAQAYAGQLDGVYQQFALNMSKGIRQRRRSTGIYALTMQAIVDASDSVLIEGFRRSDIYDITHAKEPRIQKGNLKTVLQKLGELQHNSYQGSLVVAYDESTDAVTVVDMQLLFYRKHHTMSWPWEEIADEANQEALFEADDTELK